MYYTVIYESVIYYIIWVIHDTVVPRGISLPKLGRAIHVMASENGRDPKGTTTRKHVPIVRV